jgi:hypothetical protein
MQYIGNYAEIVFTADDTSTFKLLVADPSQGFEGGNGDGWLLDLAARIAGSDWAAGHGVNAEVVSVTYFGAGRDVPLT